jgi:hypothetical protein
VISARLLERYFSSTDLQLVLLFPYSRTLAERLVVCTKDRPFRKLNPPAFCERVSRLRLTAAPSMSDFGGKADICGASRQTAKNEGPSNLGALGAHLSGPLPTVAGVAGAFLALGVSPPSSHQRRKRLYNPCNRSLPRC